MTSSLRLKKHEERRLRAGHLWIYSNEIDVKQTPLTQFTPGQPVIIEAYNGNLLGSGYVNPHSLICARLLSRNPDELLNKNLLIKRLKQALLLREQLFTQPYYRLVFAESDLLPGLIVDRYGDTLVVQLTTAGMESIKQSLCEALLEVIKPCAILLRNDSNVRELENLPKAIEILYGNPAKTVEIIEHDCRFNIPIWEGQKTGWFYDQRYNRAQLQKYVNNKRVLDVFSYIGAWSVQAAH
jgi:23S rRNA (cytosine1962-C5)-methyltransferase